MHLIAPELMQLGSRPGAGPNTPQPDIPLPPEPDAPNPPDPGPPPRPFDPEHPFPDYEDVPPVKPSDSVPDRMTPEAAE